MAGRKLVPTRDKAETEPAPQQGPVSINFARQASFARADTKKTRESEIADFQVREVDSIAAMPPATPTMQLLMGNDYLSLTVPSPSHRVRARAAAGASVRRSCMPALRTAQAAVPHASC